MGLLNPNKNNYDTHVYPNPAYDHITITSSNNQLSEITIENIMCQQLVNMSFFSQTSINIYDLTPGIYFYKIRIKNELTKTGKFIKR